MTPKEAIVIAKDYVADLFAADGARDIGLEELQFDWDAGQWLVTVGFTRPWDRPQTIVARVGEAVATSPRTFKTVQIEDATGRTIGVLHWPVAA